MAELDRNNPLRQELVGLIVAIADEVPMAEENQVLLMYKLNTEDRVLRFNDWLKTKLKDGKLVTTEAEICRAAVKVSKGLDPIT